MADSIMHLVGICPDSGVHIDLIDLIAVYGFLFSNVFYILKLKYIQIKTWLFG